MLVSFPTCLTYPLQPCAVGMLFHLASAILFHQGIATCISSPYLPLNDPVFLPVFLPLYAHLPKSHRQILISLFNLSSAPNCSALSTQLLVVVAAVAVEV